MSENVKTEIGSAREAAVGASRTLEQASGHLYAPRSLSSNQLREALERAWDEAWVSIGYLRDAFGFLGMTAPGDEPSTAPSPESCETEIGRDSGYEHRCPRCNEWCWCPHGFRDSRECDCGCPTLDSVPAEAAGERPHRAFEMDLHIGADTIQDLLDALRQVEHAVDRGSRTSVSGGPSCGYTLEIKERPEMTHDRYAEELRAYLDARKESTNA